MYTIKRAAEQVGITAATLRAWERRYGIVAPQRSEGGYRLYDEQDVRALTLMVRLVDDGWTPSLAAGEVRQRLSAVHALPSEPADGPAARRDFEEPLIAAAAVLDVRAIGVLLDEMFSVASYEVVAEAHLLPAMEALGEAWAAGRVGVAGEHLASHAAMRRLAAAFEAAAPYGSGPPVLVGTPPGARHEVGLLAFAVAARRRGLAVDYLGADLPVDDWVRAVGDRAPAAIVLAVPTLEDVEPANAVVAAVREAHPGVLIALGGSEQDRAAGEVLRLGHAIGVAATELAGRVLAPGSPGWAEHEEGTQ
ncbi:MAG TPA: MerR family transcriptional regulator [Actinomycetales bacterium]|nr:MerR family transcriptional regulator [Actinomycetales bacterium]